MAQAQTAAKTGSGLAVLDQRPAPGTPRSYRFPSFTRDRLPNGLTVIQADLPGRPLLAANLLMLGGAVAEPRERAGVTSLAARALSEGTLRRDAIELVEAAERLGAELHADAGWENFGASLEVPRSRFGPALALLAEMVLEPSFPENEVERLRDERLNDLLQARAEPRRRVERAFAEAIYSPASPFSRPMGGTEETVPGLDRDAVVERHGSLLDPRRATLVVAGDLTDVPVMELAGEHFGGWSGDDRPDPGVANDDARSDAPRVLLIDRAEAPQSELRVGHVGLRRKIADFHAVAVLGSILGGLFNSRLQRLLREERGYTYGAAASFDLRASAGPFAVRTAVRTDVTAPAIGDILGELRRIRDAPVEQRELDEARDYLIGVFPLRFEAPQQVVAAITGLLIFGLPDDELDRYRPGIAAVGADEVLAAAQHIRPDDASIVVVGDASRVERELGSAGFGEVNVIREPLVGGEEPEEG